jgi:conjugative transfer signal peptidase TraF
MRWTRLTPIWPLIGLLVFGLGLHRVRVNLTPSLPRGLYRLHPVTDSLSRGSLVIIPVPASIRPFHSRWLPLLKPVAGLAGDLVCRRQDTLVINGESFGPIAATSQGQTVPTIVREGACFTVPEGSVFLASHADRSLDSRYFGAVAIAQLTGVAVPVWTW